MVDYGGNTNHGSALYGGDPVAPVGVAEFNFDAVLTLRARHLISKATLDGMSFKLTRFEVL